MFSKIFGGKNPIKSFTAWGLAFLAGGKALEQGGVLPPGTTPDGQEVTNALVDFTTALGGLLVVLGLRKAATAPNDG